MAICAGLAPYPQRKDGDDDGISLSRDRGRVSRTKTRSTASRDGEQGERGIRRQLTVYRQRALRGFPSPKEASCEQKSSLTTTDLTEGAIRTATLSRIRALRDESRGANKAQLAAAPLTGTRHAARRYQAPKSASLREEWRKTEVWRRTALRRTTPRPDLVKRRGWSLPRGKTTGPSMAFRQVKPKGGCRLGRDTRSNCGKQLKNKKREDAMRKRDSDRVPPRRSIIGKGTEKDERVTSGNDQAARMEAIHHSCISGSQARATGKRD